jgi:23S rRNA pseudouridine2605 synthase
MAEKSKTMRLNKFIASAGAASRRGADRLIGEGRVTVNGSPAEIGMLVDPERDHVKVDGKLLQREEQKVHLVLYKPAGYMSSSNDPEGRPIVTDLLPEHRGLRLFTVGRLDFNSEGLILLTNDGEFASVVGHPSTGPAKTYQVRVRGVPDDATLEKLRKGITIDGHKAKPVSIKKKRALKNSWIEVVLKEGRNQQIRRMFKAVGHPVVRLRRVRIGPVTAQGLKPGRYRLLTQSEIDRLRRP